MTRTTPEQNIKILRLMKRAIDEDRLVPSFHPLLPTRFPTHKTYLLQCHLKTATGQLIPYNNLRKLAGITDMGAALNRWMITTGLQTLKRMHLQQPKSVVIIPQSISALQDPEYPRWLERQGTREDVSTRGLVISFKLSQIAKNLQASRDCLTALHQADIQTMIDHFSEHPAAVKILKAMNSRYISVSSSLLKADDEVVKKLIEVCHRRSVLILLPGINRPEDVNLYWSHGADLLEGAYIHPATDDTSFSFSPTII